MLSESSRQCWNQLCRSRSSAPIRRSQWRRRSLSERVMVSLLSLTQQGLETGGVGRRRISEAQARGRDGAAVALQAGGGAAGIAGIGGGGGAETPEKKHMIGHSCRSEVVEKVVIVVLVENARSQVSLAPLPDRMDRLRKGER